MKLIRTKKIIVWLCLGLYFLLGSINFANAVTCFDMNHQQSLKSEQAECTCCKHVISDNYSESIQISNIDNCDCVTSTLPVSNVEQVNSPATENIWIDKIAVISDVLCNVINFEYNKSITNHYLDYRIPLNCNLNILRTVVLII